MYSCTHIEHVKNQLIEIINNSQLPIGLGMYIVKDLYNTLYLIYTDELEKEKRDIINGNNNERTETFSVELNDDDSVKKEEEEEE